MKPGRRTTAGFVLTAAGMLASRLGVRRNQQAPAPAHQPDARPAAPESGERTASPEELERARAELTEELARRAASE